MPEMIIQNEKWNRYFNDPSREEAAIACSQGVQVAQVLDIGCGDGQELIPFVTILGADGIGLDPTPHAGVTALKLFDQVYPKAHVGFLRGSAENLPFGSDSFDLVICRLVLPYTDNVVAIGEIDRVLRPGGRVILKIHHFRYYLRMVGKIASPGGIRSALYASRTILAGVVYHLFGKQFRNKVIGSDTFQTKWLLQKELARKGLIIRSELSDTNPATPSFLIERKQ